MAKVWTSTRSNNITSNQKEDTPMSTDIESLITDANKLSVGDKVVLITYNGNSPVHVNHATVTKLLKTKMTLRFTYADPRSNNSEEKEVTEDIEYSTVLNRGELIRYANRNKRTPFSRVSIKLYATTPKTAELVAWVKHLITAAKTRVALIDAVETLRTQHGNHDTQSLYEIKELTQKIIDAENSAARIEQALRKP